MASYSGLFGFVPEGRWLQGFAVMDDGTFTDRHGVALDAIDLEAECYTVRAITSAVIDSGKRTRLDLVNSAGLDLERPTVAKGRATLRVLITRRCGDKAATVIAAIEARASFAEAA